MASHAKPAGSGTKRIKGKIIILEDRCKGCDFCVEHCPRDVLGISTQFNEKGYHPPEVINEENCTFCGLCERICPDFAIYITTEEEVEEVKPEVKKVYANRNKNLPIVKSTMKGEFFMQGDIACAEGAIAAGCRFFGGYPITPASEIAERMAYRLPMLDGVFIQFEDEIASMASIIGASFAGMKSFTATSGPGISLMTENIGLGMMMEAPCVVVNVQRGSPSTGLPTSWGQSDMMQAKWGSHGDYGSISLCPKSPQEIFDLTIRAFNLAEKYRLPVFIMTDAIVGHMTEKVVIPPVEEIEIFDRKYTNKSTDKYLPYEIGKSMIPDFAKAGDGYRYHTTGLTHDERGYPDMTEQCQKSVVTRLVEKITKNIDDIMMIEEIDIEGADVIVVCYGITARTVIPAIEKAKKKGIKVGYMRLITVWPFPEQRIKELSRKCAGFVVPELNLGQIALEVERCAFPDARTKGVTHAGGGIHDFNDIVKAIEEVAHGKK
ncbi:2-oxoacid:acceptor oxidoreductase subunit alpha [bacterium]|nr:2-oxoacid:acceptor oxidoreductase subunit alpha [bacterium]